jgi:hypothetical protein
VEGFELDVLGKIPLQEMVDIKVQAEEEVTWVEREDKMVLDQGQ